MALAGALVHEPRLIILDEPFTGLDAASARLVKNVLRERVGAGCSVIMTTHILEVAERMADRIGVMSGGRLVAEGTLEDLRRQAGAGHATLEDTFLALVETDAARADRRMIEAGTTAWFAQHETRLAWRDWAWLLSGGRRRRGYTVALGPHRCLSCSCTGSRI